MKKLSIIIPYYNAEVYTNELLDCLNPQITDDVECVLIDDGSDKPYKSNYKWCKVYRKKNGGCATARNLGLDKTTGEYISFIDADDLVSKDYIKNVLNVIQKEPDVIELSWKSLSDKGPQHDRKLNTQQDRLSNPSVCTRVFKRSFIGNARFNELKDSTEDEDFSRKIGYLDPDKKFKRAVITDYMYYYRTAIDNSKVKRFKKGLMRTKRIVYYFDRVTKHMSWLIDEIKQEDQINEVWLLTNQNDLPELKRYCQIAKPMNIWGHELRGEAFDKFTQIEVPVKAQLIFYCEYANMIGGIPTFLYNTCQHLKSEYDILVLYDKFDDMQIQRLNKVVRTMKNDPKKHIACDTLVLNRLTDKIPPNVDYKKVLQMCHACRQLKIKITDTHDGLINVSQASKDSWGDLAKQGTVIHNTSYAEPDELLLISATRMQVGDKGDNDNRIRTLANMLNDAHIPFVWLNFSDKPLNNPPDNFINMRPRVNIQPFIKRADYLVQLSDVEAYSMSVLEALTLNTPILVTPFPSVFEQGFQDGIHGYVIPYDMNFDVTKILNIPKFEFSYDNEQIVKQWKKTIGNVSSTKHSISIDRTEHLVKVRAVVDYKDLVLQKMIKKGEILEMNSFRAYELMQKRIVEVRV